MDSNSRVSEFPAVRPAVILQRLVKNSELPSKQRLFEGKYTTSFTDVLLVVFKCTTLYAII